MVRWQNAIFVAIPILDMVPSCWTAFRRRPGGLDVGAIAKGSGLFVGGGCVGFLLQLYF